MAKPSKTTKKFQKKHLDGVIKRRKVHRAEQRGKKHRSVIGERTASTKPDNEDVIENMTMDDFLAGGSLAQGDKDEDSEASESDGDAIEEHAADLAGLKAKDPEFYKYLEENDAELLNFGDDDEDEIAADEDIPDESPATIISLAQVDQMAESLANDTTKGFQRLVTAFKNAVTNAEVDESPEVLQKIVTLAVNGVPKFLRRVVPAREGAERVRPPQESKRLSKLTPTIKTFLSSLLHLLDDLSDSAMQRQVLDSLTDLVPYTLSNRRLCRDLVRSTVRIWSSSPEGSTRVSAILVARQFAMTDSALRQLVLRELYTTFVREARAVSTLTIGNITLMKNSAAELYGVDVQDSYALAFNFIRQLAIVLRKAVNDKTEEARRTISSQQFCQSIDFWCTVLARHPATNLDSLIYPLVQVALGAARTVTSPQNFPMRFALVRSLLRLSEACDVFVPLAGLLWDVLDSAEMRRKPKPSTIKPMSMETSVRAKQELLRTSTYHEQLGETTCDLLTEFFAIHASSIAFPELCVPVSIQLKRYVRRCSDAKLARRISALLDRLQANAQLVEHRRKQIDWPKQRQLELAREDTPLGKFLETQRTLQGERRKIMETQ
ncbi:Nucleolar Complex 2 protein [Savitreella phatthalungensis]